MLSSPHLVDMGKFTGAAKHLETIAGLYEGEGALKEAISAFQRAADFYAGENSNARAGKCLEQVAFLSATEGEVGGG